MGVDSEQSVMLSSERGCMYSLVQKYVNSLSHNFHDIVLLDSPRCHLRNKSAKLLHCNYTCSMKCPTTIQRRTIVVDVITSSLGKILRIVVNKIDRVLCINH